MNVLSIASEQAPYAQTGGLADVAAALPAALAERGHRVVTVTPSYARPADALAWDTGVRRRFWLFGGWQEVGYRCHRVNERLAQVLVSSPVFERPGIYGDSAGPYGDNLMRYALLCRAALEVPRAVSALADGPEGLLGEDVVVHAHDWHAALAPVYLRAHYHPVGLYHTARTVLTLHNAAHQGRYSGDVFGGLDLSQRHWETVAWGDTVCALKAGIVSADAVTAVSPTFAQDLRTPEGGFGLDPFLRRTGVTGILNGIDVGLWDPATDPHTAAPYSAQDLAGKALCKAALQEELGLPVRPEVPLYAMVARLDFQKGVDAVLKLAPWLSDQDLQLVVLGSGSAALERGLRAMQAGAPRRVRVVTTFDVPLSHRIYAGADFLLVPSLFEPCGLTQLYAMRYGAVPVVRSTGGLRDSVPSWNPATGEGCGWTYGPPEELGTAVYWSFRTWWDHPGAYRRVQANGMGRDWSWSRAAEAMERVYAGA